jgi:acyl-coenzyme A synthetase/AMP-(fatty) acid ligase
VETTTGLLLPVPCEAIFNLHPDVFRTAVVGVGEMGEQKPVLVVEPRTGKYPFGKENKARFAEELLKLGAEHGHTQPIQTVLFYTKSFPVDVRHNAKVERLELRAWAEKRLR